MKIIRKGSIPKETFLFECRHCRTIYEIDDRKEMLSRETGSDGREYISSLCPLCVATVWWENRKKWW